MNNILNAQEAFTAIQQGKNVLCRFAGNGALPAEKDFSTLDQMPAMVFVWPNYEFCIQIEMIELAGIRFTKPLTIDEIEQGQDVFLIQPHAVILQYKYSEDIEELVYGIRSGFAQRDAENAKLQYEAFCKAVGFNPLEANIEIIEQNQKKRSRKQKPSTSDALTQLDSVNDDMSIDDIIGPVSEQSLPQVDEPIKTQSSDYCDTLDEQLEFVKLRDDLLNRATNGKTPEEVNALARYTRTWTEEQRAPLLRAMHKRLEELQSQVATVQQEPPSLMVQIQNAPDLTTLDALEIDVSTRHPDIQPRLMGYVKKRRYELEQATSAAVNDEALP